MNQYSAQDFETLNSTIKTKNKIQTNEKKNTRYHSVLFLLPLKGNPHLPSASIGLLSTRSVTVKLHTIHRNFHLDKSKCRQTQICTTFKTYKNYTGQQRSTVAVGWMQVFLCHGGIG